MERYVPHTTNPELDRRVATEIMGFDLDEGGNIITMASDRTIVWPGLLPQYSTDIAAARSMEEQLARLGLHEAYAIALARLLKYDRSPAGAFRLIHATPRQRCEAALIAVRWGE